MASIPTFGIDYVLVQEMFRGFDFREVKDSIDAIITRKASYVCAFIKHQGVDPATLVATDLLWQLAQDVTLSRVAAEVHRQFTHQDASTSTTLEKNADKAEVKLQRMAESFITTHDKDEHRGTFRWTSVGTGSRTAKWDGIFGN